jgi:hypothetical protein
MTSGSEYTRRRRPAGQAARPVRLTGSRVHPNAPTSYEYELSARRAALITRMSHTHRNRPDPTQPMHAAPPVSVPFLCAIVLRDESGNPNC